MFCYTTGTMTDISTHADEISHTMDVANDQEYPEVDGPDGRIRDTRPPKRMRRVGKVANIR
jgi:hypothetical protein